MIRRTLLATVFVASGFVGGMVLSGRFRTADEAVAAPPPATQPAQAQAAATLTAGLPDLSGVASRAIPSVMNITSLQIVRQNSPFASDPMFRYFFGDRDDMLSPRNRISQSLGSGVVVSSDGYILTNNHVVGDARAQVSVVLADKRELRAKIIGTDEMTDIALLKIDARGQPVLPWGDSSKLKVAEWVLAIGNPFQLNQTVTLGIISALGRTNVGISAYEDFIQTDAAINPGNSGGALVNARGELVGINTAIFSQSGGYQGIGFAVPSNLARRVVADLTRYGEVRRGSIGYVEIAPLSTLMAEQLGVSGGGVLVQAMRRDSAAYEAGMRPGDVIVGFNGTAITDGGQLSRLIQDARIGSTAAVAVFREGRRLDLKVPIGSN